jgi:hypothetical protein
VTPEGIAKMKRWTAFTLAFLLTTGVAFGQQMAAPEPQKYTPALGEFMLNAQARHAKLWFAGSANNWELAEYLIDELKEGLEDAGKYIPVLKGVPIGQMIGPSLDGPIDDMEKVIKAKDRTRFMATFTRLTEACNSCHQAAGRPFIVVQRPSGPLFTNQSFTPAKK